jgi:hypothetical protein
MFIIEILLLINTLIFAFIGIIWFIALTSFSSPYQPKYVKVHFKVLSRVLIINIIIFCILIPL